jgi:hypothetical protein
MGTDCLVCCEKFNKSTRKKIDCSFCEYDVCIGCAKQYMFSSIQEIHCMNCKKGWNLDLLEKFYTKKFCNEDYRKYRNDKLFENEKSMLPATQPYVEIEIKTRKINLQIIEIQDKIKQHEKKINEIDMENEPYIERLIKTGLERQEIAKYRVQIDTHVLIRNFITHKKVSDSERRAFIKACPATDCKGFLSTKWKCGVCDTAVCNNCNEIKVEETEHTCKEENILSMRLLSKDSKSCPKCAAMIFKIDGCDQMYCVECHTPFSWKTGQIVSGTIHNPHYYEYLRRSGKEVPRAIGDNPNQCDDGLVAYQVLQPNIVAICSKYKNSKNEYLPQFINGNIYNRNARTYGYYNASGSVPPESILLDDGMFKAYAKKITHILNIHQKAVHISNVEIPRYRPQVINEDTNRNLRVQYMMNELTENNFKSILGTRDKIREKSNENTLIFQTLISVMTDLLREASYPRTTIQKLSEIYNNFSELKDYINDCFGKVGKRYNCVSIFIDEAWYISSDGIEKRRKEAEKAREQLISVK